MEEITRMQQNLLLIRRTVGWTAEEFGEKIGVTRQTINNIESGRNKLTKTQYIAMRSVLDAEIIQSPQDTEMLKVLLDVLVDSPEKYSDEDAEAMVVKANMMSPSILAGTTSRSDVSKEWIKSNKETDSWSVIASLLGTAGAGLIGPTKIVGSFALASAWLLKTIGNGKNTKSKSSINIEMCF